MSIKIGGTAKQRDTARKLKLNKGIYRQGKELPSKQITDKL